ncbi:MAG: thiopurine S-methyltransferase [Myxococcota bacterium]
MDEAFWASRWEDNRIGFHRDTVHPSLVDYAERLASWPGTVFVPLAGKTVDLRWLAERGCSVIAIELVPKAVEDFFSEQQLSFDQSSEGALDLFRAEDLPISFYRGDVFDLRPQHLSTVTWVHDRAALVALPPESRARYGRHLSSILPPRAELLVTTFEYPQHEMEGPPFSVPEAEVADRFDAYRFELWSSRSVLPSSQRFRERGVSAMDEHVLHGVRKS